MPHTFSAPESQYDAIVIDPVDGMPVTIEQLAQRLQTRDVVIVGEYHGHHGSHLLQAQLQRALFRLNPAQVLSMEQFNADHQQELTRYLDGKTGETEMIEDAEAWDNYRASYRPLVEFARTHRLPVIAANAPSRMVRCVGRKGPDYLQSLPPERKALLPDQPFMDTESYREKFIAAITGSHGTRHGDTGAEDEDDRMSPRILNSYRAQLLRDNTMASRIIAAAQTHPNSQILHLTGTFHSEDGLGTVALLKQRAPELRITVISPQFWTDQSLDEQVTSNRFKGDYLYFIRPLPDEFIDEERERKAMMERFRNASDNSCD
ncbi:ChaN family lipoprotein [Marinobacter salinexigens]|uniref:ChaN family lipoprotein n=2 Tax=Marinobacter salinexigens TaxID=2919747 RepID=A0A5B0VP72_9GAMM|nr:ChaN family lipoprotein [Marinobacter salinexigens]